MFLCLPEELYILSSFFVRHIHKFAVIHCPHVTFLFIDTNQEKGNVKIFNSLLSYPRERFLFSNSSRPRLIISFLISFVYWTSPRIKSVQYFDVLG